MKTRMTVSLQDAFPEIAAQWHPTKNGNLTPDMIAAGSNKKVAWLLPYDDPTTGKHFDFEWSATIYSRTSGMSICPFLSGKAVWTGFNDLATKRPDIAVYWNWEKNGDNKPTNFTEDSHVSVWWKYPYRDPKTGREFVFEWQDKIVNRVNTVEFCPFIKNNARVYPGFNDLLTTHPIIAGQWHPTKNGSLKPEMVTAGSSKTVVWLLPYDDPNTGNHFDFEWSARIADRTINGYGCPFLSGKQAWRGYNDLKTLFPDIAAQWHPCKNGNLRPDSVTPYSVKRV